MSDPKHLKNISRARHGPQVPQVHRQGTEKDKATCPRAPLPLHFCPRRLLEAAHLAVPRPPAGTAKHSCLWTAAVVGEAVQQGLCH